jgi:hypothetical protein
MEKKPWGYGMYNDQSEKKMHGSAEQYQKETTSMEHWYQERNQEPCWSKEC